MRLGKLPGIISYNGPKVSAPPFCSCNHSFIYNKKNYDTKMGCFLQTTYIFIALYESRTWRLKL